MVNKNDTSDLEGFSMTAAGIIAVFVAFIALGYFLIASKYVGIFDANISNLINQELRTEP